jgi:hypothetical protein
VVGGGFCIALGSLDRSTADGDDNNNLFSIPSPPPPRDAVLLSQLGRRGGIDVDIVWLLPKKLDLLLSL